VRFLDLSKSTDISGPDGNATSNARAFAEQAAAEFRREGEIENQAWEADADSLVEAGADLTVRQTGDRQLEGYLREVHAADSAIEIIRLGSVSQVIAGLPHYRFSTTEDGSQAATARILRVGDVAKGRAFAKPMFLV